MYAWLNYSFVGDLEGIKSGIENGVDINIKNHTGLTALLWASEQGNWKCFHL